MKEYSFTDLDVATLYSTIISSQFSNTNFDIIDWDGHITTPRHHLDTPKKPEIKFFGGFINK